MDISTRISAIMFHYGEKQASFASKIGMHQQTLSRYLKDKNSKALSPYLWSILEVFPEINREWLFFGEGNMLGKSVLQQRVDELETSMRQLATRVAIEGLNDKRGASGLGKVADGPR